MARPEHTDNEQSVPGSAIIGIDVWGLPPVRKFGVWKEPCKAPKQAAWSTIKPTPAATKYCKD